LGTAREQHSCNRQIDQDHFFHSRSIACYSVYSLTQSYGRIVHIEGAA
jgi:hypothetical protein